MSHRIQDLLKDDCNWWFHVWQRDQAEQAVQDRHCQQAQLNFQAQRLNKDWQNKKDVILINPIENILNIKDYWNSNMFDAYITRKLNQKKFRIFYSLSVIFFLCPFSSYFPCDRFFLSSPALSDKLFSSWPAFASNPSPDSLPLYFPPLEQLKLAQYFLLTNIRNPSLITWHTVLFFKQVTVLFMKTLQ